jgi:hypothetical protein
VNRAKIRSGAIYRYYPKHLREDPSCGACRAVNGGVVRVTLRPGMRGKVPGFVRLMWRFAKFPVFEDELGEEA